MNLLKRLIRYVFPYKKNVVLIFLANICYSLFSVVSLSMVIPFLSVLFEKIPPLAEKPAFAFSTQAFNGLFNYYMGLIIENSGKVTALIAVACTITLFSFLSNLFRYLALYLLAPIRSGLIHDLRRDTYHKLLILPLSFYQHEKKGDIMNRLGSDVQEVEWSIVSMLQMLFRDPLLIIIYLFSLFFVSTKLTLLTLGILLPASYFIILLGKKINRKSADAQSLLGRLSAIIEETIGGLRIIKGYNAIDYAEKRFKEENHIFYKLSKKIFIRTELASPLVEILSIFCLVIVLFLGGNFILDGTDGLSGELFVFYILIFSRLIPSAKSLVSCYYNLQKGLPSAKRIYQIIDGDEKIIETENPIPITELHDKIEYENVSFGYYPGQSVLKDVSFTLQKGKTLAIVGHSGGGKSTLVDLLPRFYDYENGKISIDGIDIKKLKIKDLRNLFGIVNQDVTLFNDSVYHNIAFGMHDATPAAVEAAAKIANVHDFIMEMEHGYDTIIGDRGTKLSGGQRQRLSIARAILRNPQILILDEATSALDSESEFLVQQAIDKLLQHRTAIIIAHRLSTIRNADEILFMEGGRIIEKGTHDELMHQRGAYYKFCVLQQS